MWRSVLDRLGNALSDHGDAMGGDEVSGMVMGALGSLLWSAREEFKEELEGLCSLYCRGDWWVPGSNWKFPTDKKGRMNVMFSHDDTIVPGAIAFTLGIAGKAGLDDGQGTKGSFRVSAVAQSDMVYIEEDEHTISGDMFADISLLVNRISIRSGKTGFHGGSLDLSGRLSASFVNTYPAGVDRPSSPESISVVAEQEISLILMLPFKMGDEGKLLGRLDLCLEHYVTDRSFEGPRERLSESILGMFDGGRAHARLYDAEDKLLRSHECDSTHVFWVLRSIMQHTN